MPRYANCILTIIIFILTVPANAKGTSEHKQNRAVNMDNCMREKAKTIPEEKKQRKICLEELGIESKKPK